MGRRRGTRSYRRQRSGVLATVARWATGQYQHHQEQVRLQQAQMHFQQQQWRLQQDRRGWLANVQSPHELWMRDPGEFEHIVAEVLRLAGYQRIQRTGGAGDRGVDVTCWTPFNEYVIVQCKRYAHDNAVGSVDMQKFAGAFMIHNAPIGMFVTTSSFTPEARKIAQGMSRQRRLYLMDGPALVKWIKQLHAGQYTALPARNAQYPNYGPFMQVPSRPISNWS